MEAVVLGHQGTQVQFELFLLLSPWHFRFAALGYYKSSFEPWSFSLASVPQLGHQDMLQGHILLE